METVEQNRDTKKLSAKEIFACVANEMQELDDRLMNRISADSGILSVIVQEVFKAGGKRVRPAICFLVYKALLESNNENIQKIKNDPSLKAALDEKVFLTAELTELIHSASLVHDDIIDNSLVRRGLGTVNSKWDNAITVISGDFMFARAAVNLGKLECNEVVKLYANVLELLCDGEIEQVEKKYNPETTWDYYLSKNYKKTGSLIEAPAKAPACLFDLDDELKNKLADYGKNIGAAFQIIDDILDYTADEETLGKPSGSDLKDGHLTAPVLYALEEFNDEDTAQLKQDVVALASSSEGLPDILDRIKASSAIEKSQARAFSYAENAKAALEILPESIYKEALLDLADYVVAREF